MRIETQNYNNVTFVQLQGELAADFVQTFCDTCSDLMDNNAPCVVLDMSKVSFIDSTALERLLWLRDFAAQAACQLKIAALDENCAKILEITRLKDKFDSYAELAEAVKSFA